MRPYMLANISIALTFKQYLIRYVVYCYDDELEDVDICSNTLLDS